MTSTVVRDSIVGDAWIQTVASQVPVQRIVDPKTGLPTGEILTGPVRLAYPNIFQLPKKREGQASEPKFGSSLLFTPYADFSIFYEEYYKACGQFFPEYFDQPTQQYHGLHSPFRDQSEKIKNGGFTPGLVFFSSTSKFKPPVVDGRGNPVVDESKVYPGAWAICAVKPYPYGKNPPQPKKGIGFGLQSVMLIGDDTKFGNAAPDAKAHYQGINVAAPIARPNVGAMPAGGVPPPAAGIPGYTNMGGGYAPPAAAPIGAPTPPFTPPAAGYAAPPQQATYVPPATTSPTETEDQRLMREMGLG